MERDIAAAKKYNSRKSIKYDDDRSRDSDMDLENYKIDENDQEK